MNHDCVTSISNRVWKWTFSFGDVLWDFSVQFYDSRWRIWKKWRMTTKKHHLHQAETCDLGTDNHSKCLLDCFSITTVVMWPEWVVIEVFQRLLRCDEGCGQTACMSKGKHHWLLVDRQTDKPLSPDPKLCTSTQHPNILPVTFHWLFWKWSFSVCQCSTVVCCRFWDFWIDT